MFISPDSERLFVIDHQLLIKEDPLNFPHKDNKSYTFLLIVLKIKNSESSPFKYYLPSQLSCPRFFPFHKEDFSKGII